MLHNSFGSGRIPQELGNLTILEVLWLTECNLIGKIPSSLGRLKKLTDLDLAINNLSGEFPSLLTELPRRTSPIGALQQLVDRRASGRGRELDGVKTPQRVDESVNRNNPIWYMLASVRRSQSL
ncbi:Receptor-like protein kinase HSL1 [Linum grandiflorum]